VTQSVGDVLILFFRFQFNVVLVTFRVEVLGDWSVESFLFPLLDVLEIMLLVEGGVGDESILIGENEFLVVNVLSFKSQILEFWLYWSVFVHVFIDSSQTVFVWSV